MDEQVNRIVTAPGRRRVGARRVRLLPWLVAAVVLAVVVGVVLWWHPWGGQRRGAAIVPPQAIREAAAASADVPIIITALGTVTPLATVTVQTQISGQLIDVGFKEGQEVRKGDFLAQIDPRPYQIALQQAQGTLAHDQALLQDARIDLARYQTLSRQDSIARQQVDTQQYLVHQYEGTTQSDAAAVDTQKLNLAYCHIVAPVDGRVGLRLVDPGNYIQIGNAQSGNAATTTSTGLVVITQLKPISVLFSVPEDDIPQIVKRMNSGATLPVTARNRADTSLIATGVLSTLDNQVDTTTGTVRLRASFANTDETLFPNQFVNVGLLVDTLQGAVVVPTPAIQRGAPGTFVYLVNADDTVSVKPVKVGPDNGQVTAITSGLAVGDNVVIDGADRLRDGARVTIPAASAPAAPAAAPVRRSRPAP